MSHQLETIIGYKFKNPELLEIGAQTLRFQCIALPTTGMMVLTNMLLQNIRATFQASFLSMARQGLFFIPLLFLLQACFGLTGIQMAQSAADVAAFALAIPFCLNVLKKMK